jgi:resolvase-like protein
LLVGKTYLDDAPLEIVVFYDASQIGHFGKAGATAHVDPMATIRMLAKIAHASERPSIRSTGNGSKPSRPHSSTRYLLNTLAAITGKGAGCRSLHDTWADTATAHGRLMLTMLGGLAEFERDLIRARTGEGRKRAVANGVRF